MHRFIGDSGDCINVKEPHTLLQKTKFHYNLWIQEYQVDTRLVLASNI